MKRTIYGILILVLMVGMIACCSTKTESTEGKHTEEMSKESGESKEDSGEHKEMSAAAPMESSEHVRDSGEGQEEGKESGTEYAKDATYDGVRNGAHLILKYNPDTNSFIGTVENITEKILERVRVEVHLSNGIELGPTSPVNLAPGIKSSISLKASETAFETWSTHPEVGNNEHGHGVEEGEHTSGEKGEHGEKRGEYSSREKGEHSEKRGEHR